MKEDRIFSCRKYGTVSLRDSCEYCSHHPGEDENGNMLKCKYEVKK